MRTHELIDHRYAVLVQAWDSGKTEWFIKRCIKYAEVCPDSIWRGVSLRSWKCPREIAF
jgi:hypothetical protein